jgi:hypothetical protein
MDFQKPIFQRIGVAFSLFLMFATTISAQTRAGFTVGPITAKPGEKASGTIQVPATTDEGTTIPISIVHGSQPGPVFALIAGNHGYEYTPIIAVMAMNLCDLTTTGMSMPAGPRWWRNQSRWRFTSSVHLRLARANRSP